MGKVFSAQPGRNARTTLAAGIAAIALVAASAGVARAYQGWCSSVAPQFVAVPQSLQSQSSDAWGSYSVKLAVDLDGTVHALKPTYDDPQQALENFEKSNGIIAYLQERSGLPAFSQSTVGEYAKAAATIDRTTIPDEYAEDITAFMQFTDMYDNDTDNAERVAYMQCKTGAQLQHDTYFMS